MDFIRKMLNIWENVSYKEYTLFLVNIYLFKVNNRNIRKRCKIYSKLTTKSFFATLLKSHFSRRRSGVFIVNFEHISYLFLVFLFSNLNKQMLAGILLFSIILKKLSILSHCFMNKKSLLFQNFIQTSAKVRCHLCNWDVVNKKYDVIYAKVWCLLWRHHLVVKTLDSPSRDPEYGNTG